MNAAPLTGSALSVAAKPLSLVGTRTLFVATALSLFAAVLVFIYCIGISVVGMQSAHSGMDPYFPLKLMIPIALWSGLMLVLLPILVAGIRAWFGRKKLARQ